MAIEPLGRTLKKIRETKNLSIEEVSERSRIPKHIISAIEEDRLNEIKSHFYAKSFVRTYAGFLGALGEASVKEFLAGAGSKSSSTQSIKSVSAKSPSTVIARHEVPKQSQNRDCFAPLAMTQVDKYKRQIIAIIIGIFAFWILSSAVGHIAKAVKNASAKKQARSVIVKKEIPKKAEKEKPKEPVKEAKKELVEEKTDSVDIEVSVSGDTWLQVTGDGDVMFKGLLKKGSKDTWKARKEIKLEAGNSGVIKISVNGKPASFSGKKGEKKEITITKDGIK